MKRLLFKLCIYLLGAELMMKSNYQFKVTVFESNHPQLKIDQELAVYDINVRESKVKAKYPEFIEKYTYHNPLDSNYSFELDFINTVHLHLRNMAGQIQSGQLSLEYLIINSGKEIKPFITKEDGVEYRHSLGFKDYEVLQFKTDADFNDVLDDEGNRVYYLLKFKVTNTNEIY